MSRPTVLYRTAAHALAAAIDQIITTADKLAHEVPCTGLTSKDKTCLAYRQDITGWPSARAVNTMCDRCRLDWLLRTAADLCRSIGDGQ